MIVETVWYFLPAIAANVTPALAARYQWLPTLAKPLDGGYSWRGRRLLGDHKTWRGLVVGIALASLVGFWQGRLLIGSLLGLGALLGDVLKSFFKRRRNIAPGDLWLVADQTDFVVGAVAVHWLVKPLALSQILVAVVTLGFGSFLVSALGKQLRIKQSL